MYHRYHQESHYFECSLFNCHIRGKKLVKLDEAFSTIQDVDLKELKRALTTERCPVNCLF